MGKNDQCLCGSRKKYKHCCALKIPADINQVMESDFLELQQEILRFAVTTYEESINNCINEFFEEVIIEDEEKLDQAGILLMLWIIFSLPIAESKQTILQTYIKKHSKKIKRPALKEAIREWQAAVPSIYKVIKEETNVLYVEDIFTQEKKQIQLLELIKSRSDCLEGSYILGILINYRNRRFFFSEFYVIKNPFIIQSLLEIYDLHGDELSPAMFVDELYPEIIEIIFQEPINLEDITWDTIQQKQVVELLNENLNVVKEIKTPIESIAITLWKLYCTKTGSNIRSVPKYAAALHYIVTYFIILYGEDTPTKEELAKRYNVKIRALTETIKRLDDILEGDIDKMLYELTFNLDEEDYDLDDDYVEDDIDMYDLYLGDDGNSLDRFEVFTEVDNYSPKIVIDELAQKRAQKQKLKK